MLIRKRNLFALFLLLSFLPPADLLGWGSTGHRIINQKAFLHLPMAMASWKTDSAFVQAHASDADYRKVSGDTAFFNEYDRHFIDLDTYPSFPSLPHPLDSVISKYGRTTVRDKGTLPWATILAFDSLTAQMRRGDNTAAEQTMSDLGHYVADGHQPLHCTGNYDGQTTNNDGIHSRYETGMVNLYKTQLTIVPDSTRYIASPLDFVFGYINQAQYYVASVMYADSYAKRVSEWTGSGTPPAAYYSALWDKLGTMTQQQFRSATVDLASLWYTAWINSQVPAGVHETPGSIAAGFHLTPNWPNPFNPETNMTLTVATRAGVSAAVYDITGRAVAILLDEVKDPGTYTLRWNASGMPSGVYYCRVNSGRSSAVTRMMLIR